ncbi:hypothetical protein [Aquabacter spiritensis]|uniref:Uncharacterized protein n=1 Tax=Aquabacter spiritensis TaxID=933073 RepID=A0A4R3LRP8_9HYPH|nr:hypothetical protein [Aquabacter spiritensis]TCT02426.1 hypothetical protein EDC64_11373 [Aquabacter spiritensis]
MQGQLSLDDVIYVFTYIERMAHLMQRTRSHLTVATDTIKWVLTAAHIPVEPAEQKLTDEQKERKAFYSAVIDERRTFDKYASRNRGVADIPVRSEELGPMISMFRYAQRHCQPGHPGPQKILSRLAGKRWTQQDIDTYPVWTPPPRQGGHSH